MMVINVVVRYFVLFLSTAYYIADTMYVSFGVHTYQYSHMCAMNMKKEDRMVAEKGGGEETHT